MSYTVGDTVLIQVDSACFPVLKGYKDPTYTEIEGVLILRGPGMNTDELMIASKSLRNSPSLTPFDMTNFAQWVARGGRQCVTDYLKYGPGSGYRVEWLYPAKDYVVSKIEPKSKLVKVGNAEGSICAKCANFYPYAVPNQPDGTLKCYSCRMNGDSVADVIERVSKLVDNKTGLVQVEAEDIRRIISKAK